MLEYLRELSTLENLIVTGDFNFPDAFWPLDRIPDADNSTNNFMHFVADSNLFQLVTKPTRFRENHAPSVLDLVFTNDEQLLTEPQYLPPIGKSDHVVITTYIQLNLQISKKPKYDEITITHYDALSHELAQVNWATYLQSDTDPNSMWEKFYSLLLTCTENHSHKRIVRKNPFKPWINHELLSLIHHKRRLWKKFRRSNNRNDFQAHRIFSNNLAAALKTSRRDHEESIANSDNNKKLYKFIRANLSTKVNIPLLQKNDGSICTTDNETAEALADNFASCFSAEPEDDYLPNLLADRLENSLTDIAFTPEIVKKHLDNLKNHSSPGLDGISTFFLKKFSDILCTPLALIMSASFCNSLVPQAWKRASITPIFKKGDKLNPLNYRPISLLSVPSKIMEAIIVEEMANFLILNSVIPSEQHGFVKGRSTTTNLLSCVSDWTSAFDRRIPTDVLYLDFSKAFKRVPFKRLIHKLEMFGIRGKLNFWVQDYLWNRTFTVKAGDSFSNERIVSSGVPQGSVLGPLMFMVYVSDLALHIESKKSFYADDTKLYANPLEHYATLQNDINRISQWCSSWSLPLNIEKCVVLHIGKNNPELLYFINNHPLGAVSSHVDLGVTISSDLTWSAHIINVCKKANTIIYLIQKYFSYLNFATSIKLYKTYVRPILEYAGPVWCPVLVRDKNLLENVQRRATRIPWKTVKCESPNIREASFSRRPNYDIPYTQVQLCQPKWHVPVEPRRSLAWTFTEINKGTILYQTERKFPD